MNIFLILDSDGLNTILTSKFHMNESLNFKPFKNEICKQPQLNEIKCKGQHESPITNVTTNYEVNYYFYVWGMIEEIISTDTNLSTNTTWIRIEEKKSIFDTSYYVLAKWLDEVISFLTGRSF